MNLGVLAFSIDIERVSETLSLGLIGAWKISLLFLVLSGILPTSESMLLPRSGPMLCRSPLLPLLISMLLPKD